MPSVQLGAAHCPLTQLAELQSLATLQVALGAHFMQEPPQSLSVSSPSVMPSLQEGAAQTPDVQIKPARQSSPVLHLAIALHLVLQLPPQSMSDSAPFMILSVQLGGMAQSLLLLPHCVVSFEQTEKTKPASPAISIGKKRFIVLRISSPWYGLRGPQKEPRF
jgi:hypothetical protein